MNKTICRQLQAALVFESADTAPPMESVVFAAVSEPPTTVVLADEAGRWYRLPGHDEQLRPFSPLAAWRNGIFSGGTHHHNGWHHVRLGDRQPLFVRADYYPAFVFLSDALSLAAPEDFAAHWRGIACRLLHAAPDHAPAIESAVAALAQTPEDENWDAFVAVLEALRTAMMAEARLVLPYEWNVGDSDQPPRLMLRSMAHKDGEPLLLPAFTRTVECRKGPQTDTLTVSIRDFFETLLMTPQVDGVLLNPFGDSVQIAKDYLVQILDAAARPPLETRLYFDTIDPASLDSDCRVEPCANAGDARLWPQTPDAAVTLPRILYAALPLYDGSDASADALRTGYWLALEWARAEHLHSIAFPTVATTNDAQTTAAADVVLRTIKAWLTVNPRYAMAIFIACKDKTTTDFYRARWEADDFADHTHADNTLLESAIHFATERHSGAVRKGTNRPYILHPLETLQILAAMDADPALMAAGVLHDVLEDTDTTLGELVAHFGLEVAALVNRHSEDKSQCWYMRKFHTIDALQNASLRDKLLTLADKTANLRSMAADYKQCGDTLWERFNAPQPLQAWYYRGLIDALADLQDNPKAETIYREMCALYKDLFVLFALDDAQGRLYQLSADGNDFVLEKGRPEWLPFHDSIGDPVQRLPRKAAEQLEDTWNAPFWQRHAEDLLDADYPLWHSANQRLTLSLRDGCLALTDTRFADDGPMTPLTERLDADATHRFLVRLRLDGDLTAPLATLLQTAFGHTDGQAAFNEFCEQMGVRATSDVQ